LKIVKNGKMYLQKFAFSMLVSYLHYLELNSEHISNSPTKY